MWATTYSFWPQYKEPLLKVGDSEPDPGIRQDAREIAETGCVHSLVSSIGEECMVDDV